MITKISANGKSDINMLLVSPPAAACANAGVISIERSSYKAFAGRQIRADYSGRRPNCNAATALIYAACRRCKAPIWVLGQESPDVEKVPEIRSSSSLEASPRESAASRDKTS